MVDALETPDIPTSADLLTHAEIEQVARGLAMATFSWDAATDGLRWSANAVDILGCALPLRGSDLLAGLTDETATARVAAIAMIDRQKGGSSPYLVRYQFRHATATDAGGLFEEQGQVSFDAEGRVTGAAGTIRPVGIEKAMVVPRSVHPITGLMMRDGLLDCANQTIRQLAKARDGSAAFVVIAIDGLGQINGNFGYDIGDKIIEATVRRIAGEMRRGDLIGHLSGHKFGAILHHCSDTALTSAAERFSAAVSGELIATLATRVQVTISVGAVIVPRHAETAEAAALRAEEALSDARAQGKSLMIYHPSRKREEERQRNISSAEEIALGLEEDRFVIAYQPLVDAKTRKIVSYEALARLVRRDGTVISAGPLVATAERIGLVRRIDQRALQLVLDDLTRNPGLKLSVNVSVITLADGVWLTQLVDALSTHRDIAGRLTVEITETAAMGDLADMMRIAQTIRDVGCRVAIDDFGAGQTSFKALKDLEVDLVKIDGLYIRDLTTNPDSVAFVKTLAALVDHFKISTVAEWVQDEEAAQMLSDMGIHTLQGRYAGEPWLRHTGLSAAAINSVDPDGAERLADGYPSFGGVLRGPLSVA